MEYRKDMNLIYTNQNTNWIHVVGPQLFKLKKNLGILLHGQSKTVNKKPTKDKSIVSML